MIKKKKRGKGPEAIIENQILEWLELNKIIAWKNHSVAIFDPVKKSFRKLSKWVRPGVSDILGILSDGRFLAIEVKSKTGKTSGVQSDFLSDITSSGGVAFVARSVEDVESRLLPILHHLNKVSIINQRGSKDGQTND